MNIGAKRSSLILLLSFILTFSALAGDLYKLGSGDYLSITVWERPDLKTEVVVGPDGRIAVPLAGQIDVNNLTLEEVEQEITKRLETYIKEPLVTVQIVKYRTFRVQVLGQVAKPGFYNLDPGSKILDALAIAGGPLPSADLYDVQVGNESIDLASVLKNPQLDRSLLSGVTIYVPAARPILVLGEVAKPGSYIWQEEQTLLNIMALAGGPLESADISEVLVDDKKIDLKLIMDYPENDMKLLPGTTIYIPAKRPVLVLGAVKNPGSIIPRQKQTLIEIIAQAGGLLPEADDSSLRLERDGVIHEGTLMDLAKEEILYGDIITVTEMKQVIVAGKVMRPGAYSVKKGLTVSDVLALAGGLQNDAADLVTIVVNGERREVSVNSRETLSGGESLFVGASNQRVLVLGSVTRPGSFNWQEGFSVLDAVAMAGGQTDRADLDNAVIIRDGIRKPISWEENERLYGGDIIEIPEWQREVLIMGEINHPGSYKIERGQKLLDIIGIAGGLSENAGYQISLRLAEEFEDIDIAKALKDPSHQSNVTLKGGEVIFVPEAKQEVLVFGQVQKPGRYGYKQGDDLTTIIALAGGLTNKADVSRIEIKRGEERKFVEFGNHSLYGDEVIWVREARPITILGEVNRPGAYSVGEVNRLVELIAMAGGPTKFANLADIRVYRSGDAEQVTTVAAGRGRLVFEGGAEDNPEVYPGDVVYVSRSNKLDLAEVASYLSIISSLSNLIRVWF